MTSKVLIPTITLKEDATLLEEVKVVGELANVKAGMITYHLSERAKSSRNAYEALMEIPELIVDPVSRSISMGMSGSPLILIDGVKRTSYMDVLNPETIESVEVIQNPSARYMNDENVSCILNIKLKRVKTPVYLRGDIGAMSNTHFDNLNLFVNTEIGNSLSSLYLTGGYKKRTDEIDIVSNSLSGNLERNLKGRNVYSNYRLDFNQKGYYYYNNYKDIDLNNNKILGVFDELDNERNDNVIPSLDVLTSIAVKFMENNFPEGYFLVIECGHIDKMSHNVNIFEMMEYLENFDKSVKDTYDLLKNDPSAAIIVTSNHETGGLRYNGEIKDDINSMNLINYDGHTLVDVPYYIYFSNPEVNKYFLPEVIDNTDIYKICKALLSD